MTRHDETRAAWGAIADRVRGRVREGASFSTIIDMIHDETGTAKYARGPVVIVLGMAYGFDLRDLVDLSNCEVFGGSTSMADADLFFGELIAGRGRRPPRQT